MTAPSSGRTCPRRSTAGTVQVRRCRTVSDFWRQGMLVGLAAACDCVNAFSETDQTENLRSLDVPIFMAQGDDDQIVPIAAAARKSIELVKHGTLKVHRRASHGIHSAYQDQLDADILDFIRT